MAEVVRYLERVILLRVHKQRGLYVPGSHVNRYTSPNSHNSLDGVVGEEARRKLLWRVSNGATLVAKDAWIPERCPRGEIVMQRLTV